MRPVPLRSALHTDTHGLGPLERTKEPERDQHRHVGIAKDARQASLARGPRGRSGPRHEEQPGGGWRSGHIFARPGVDFLWLWLLLPQSQIPVSKSSPAWETQRVTDDKPRIHKVRHVRLTAHLEFLVSRSTSAIITRYEVVQERQGAQVVVVVGTVNYLFYY